MPSRIEDYALIGDCETAALVSNNGSVDWLCWPRFDSAACFAALLGDESHGRWLIAPAVGGAETKVSRRYAKNTLILETEFTCADGTGAVVLIDFMPLREGRNASHLVRLIVGKRGKVPMRMELILRFGYGGWVPWVSRNEAGDLVAIAGPDLALLRTPVELRGEGLTTVSDFVVSAGQRVPFVLTYAPSHLPLPEPIDVDEALRGTTHFWQEWAAAARTPEEHSEIVTRSLITLKALTYAPHGGIIAAPTTSLPERLGGSRNWDYRFCWLRDATLTLLSLMNAGYYDEARAWRDWLLRAAAGSPDQLQIMYGVTGKRWLSEREVPWLSGYEGSKPVRIGNAAADQLQLDVYGEVMDALHQARAGRLQYLAASWEFQRALLDHLETIWRDPDDGIWEVRGERRHFTHSKVMAWVAFDRAIKGVEFYGLKGPAEHWRQIRAEIHDEVCARAFNANLGAFTQVYDSDVLDASALLIPQVGFLPPEDARVQGTVGAIERRLLRSGFRASLRHRGHRGRLASRRRCVPAVQLLARRCVCHDRTDRGRAASVQAADRIVQRCRLAGGGIRCRRSAPARQLSASVLAYCADQYGIQSRSCGKAVRAAFRAQTDRRPVEALPASARTGGIIVGGGNARKTH